MKRMVLLVAVQAFAFATFAQAQVRVVRYEDDRLSGIKEVDVFVSISADPAGRCPIRRTAVESLARDAFGQARIKVSVSQKASSWFYSLLISVTTGVAGSHCAASLTTELVAAVEGIPVADRYAPAGNWGSLLVGSMPLIRLTDLVIAPVEEHDSAVRQAVGARVTAIAAKLRSANP